MSYFILSINPGSTSTKIGLYEDEKKIFVENVEHPSADLDCFEEIIDQLDYRIAVVQAVLKEKGVDQKTLSAVVGRGGLFPNMHGGGYLVNQALKDTVLDDLASPHASNLGEFLADAVAAPLGIPAYIYDSASSDELQPLATITGMPDVRRQCQCHVLNMRATARRVAEKYGRKYEDMKLVVAHLGGGISLSVHQGGRIIDCIRDDDGPFSPERTGSVPLLYIIDMCYSGRYNKREMYKRVRGMGGLKAYFGTPDCREIEKRIEAGDEKAKIMYEAEAYQIAKGIGLLSTVLSGDVDFIVLTGGLAHSKRLTGMVAERVSFIAPVEIMPGEDEMEALTLGTLRILRGEETASEYELPVRQKRRSL